MKYTTLLLLFGVLLINRDSIAQAPNQFNYQAIARNTNGAPLINKPIKLRLSIRHAAPAGAVQYSETRSLLTNALGLFNIAIGSPGASDITGSVGTANWQSGDKFLQVEIDTTGGNSFIDMGTTQLLSVPFALSSADNQWKANGNAISNINIGNVGIGTASPEPSALLDLASDSKGLLIPRLTIAQRTALASPAKGLLVYQTETPEGFYYNSGTAAAPNWITLGATGPQGPTGIIQSYTATGTAPYPSTTLGFISPTVTITVQTGQNVYLNTSRALGSYFNVNSASGLCIYVACQLADGSGPIQNLNLGLCGLSVKANDRITFAVNGVFANLPPGTYKFGMSGAVNPGGANDVWTNSEWGSTSALVF